MHFKKTLIKSLDVYVWQVEEMKNIDYLLQKKPTEYRNVYSNTASLSLCQGFINLLIDNLHL